MQVSKEFAEIFASLVADPTPLAKGEVVEQFNVETVSDPVSYGDNAPAFLQGKHYCIVSGERNGEAVSRSILAERMKVAWEAEGIVPTVKKVKGKDVVEIPDCLFAAEGYNQKWALKGK